MLRYLGFGIIVCLASLVQLGDGYRILCVFPAPAISHQVIFRGLTLALNKRGHELVVVTPDPLNDPTLTKYKEIDIRFDYDAFALPWLEVRGQMKWMEMFLKFSPRLISLMDRILDHPDMRKLYAPDSDEKFDLLLIESTFWQSLYPLATRFDVPIIGISSMMALTKNTHYAIGNPIVSNDLTCWELGTDISEKLSFWQRLNNFQHIYRYLYWYRTTFLAQQEALSKKYFGNDIPALIDQEKNISLIFVNQQRPISYAVPNVPKVVEIGGFHGSKKTKTLPKDLQKILDETGNGFVYVSLGSMINSTSLSKETLKKFTAAFSRLPYRVLFKFEDNSLPGKPDNVHVMKWVPQEAVLAHPNLKVFVYQGGLQSTEEALHHAVPLVGIPIANDQDMQVNKLVSLGVAKKLEIRAIDENELFESISTVATDPGYKQRMLNLRSVIDDKPQDPLETAIWWTEHIIRHRGAPQLHSTSADEPWYIRQDMDIVAFFSVGFVIILGSTLIVLYYSVERIYNCCIARELDTKKRN